MTGIAALQHPSDSEVYLSNESARTVEPVLRLLWHGREMGVTTAWTESEDVPLMATVENRFRMLADWWKKDTRYVSSLHEMVLHPAYQQIIGMGRDALPFLFEELEREPDHWFWALNAITGEDPVPSEDRGDLKAMTKHWLRWAAKRGWI